MHAPTSPAEAVALMRASASPSSSIGRSDSPIVSSIRAAAAAAPHARSHAELSGSAANGPRAGCDTCASAVLRLEGAYLLVELVGDVRELLHRRIVQGHLIA